MPDKHIMEALLGNVPSVIVRALNKHAIVSIANHAGNIVYVNPNFCEISGYSEEELIGQNHRIIKSDEHNPAFFVDLWETISSGEIWHGIIKNRAKEGHFYWVSSTIVPITDEQGRISHYFSIRTDISDHKREIAIVRSLNEDLAIHQAELSAQYDELQRSSLERDFAQRQYKALFNATTTAIIVLDDQKVIMDFNHAFADLIEKPYEMIINKPIRTFLRSLQDQPLDFLLDIYQYNNQWKQANLWVKQGVLKPVRIGISQLEVANKKATLLSLVDISHEIKSKQTYQANLEMKNRFVANMSHEIRTPLHGMIGSINLVLARGNLNEEDRLVLETAITAGNHLTRMLSDILDFSKIENGKLGLEPRPTELNKTIQNAINQLDASATSKGLQLDFAMQGDDQLSFVIIDEERFLQILLNLLVNAIKFTQQGGVTVNAKWQHVDSKHSLLRLTVSDTGIGIAASDIESILEPFVQGSLSRTKNHTGTGLGLNLVKSITEMMGGHANN